MEVQVNNNLESFHSRDEEVTLRSLSDQTSAQTVNMGGANLCGSNVL